MNFLLRNFQNYILIRLYILGIAKAKIMPYFA